MTKQRPPIRIFSAKVKQINAREGDQKPTEQTNCIDGITRIEALKHQKACHQGKGRKADIVQGIDQICAKLAERLVEVVHLGQYAHRHHNHEHVRARMCELVIASKCQLDGNAEALDRHDGHAADGTADGYVNERVRAAVYGSDAVDHYDGKNGDGCAVEEEEGLDRVVEYLIDCFDGLVWRRVEHDYDGTEEAG